MGQFAGKINKNVISSSFLVSHCWSGIKTHFPLSCQKMSFGRTQQLQELQQIIQEMSKEIMWVNDREEEELMFDWGDKNIDQYIPKKQESYSVSRTDAIKKKTMQAQWEAGENSVQNRCLISASFKSLNILGKCCESKLHEWLFMKLICIS